MNTDQPPVAGTGTAPEPNVGETLAPGLYLVSTPIGNLEDITLRALRILRSVDRIACEDTRQTQKLLNHFAIRKPTVSYHLHNEKERAEELIAELKGGSRVAVVSDAGTPAVADPGEILVRGAIEAGIPVFPIPGANAALSALVASGFQTERFTFLGFLPAKEGQRRTALERLRDRAEQASTEEQTTVILYEAPHRILEVLADIRAIFGPSWPVVVARELTKLHEEFLRGTASEVEASLRARPSIRGELVLLLEGRQSVRVESGNAVPEANLSDEVAAAMQGGMSEKDALKQVARARGLGKSQAYREWQRGRRR